MKFGLVVAMALALAGCKNERFPGFKQKTQGLYYQRIALGEGATYHPDSAFIDYIVSYSAFDSAITNPSPEKKRLIRYAQPHFSGDEKSLFYGLKAGDRINLILLDRPEIFKEFTFEDEDTASSNYQVGLTVTDVVNLSGKNETADPNFREYQRIRTFLNTGDRRKRFRFVYGIWLDESRIKPSGGIPQGGQVVLDYRGYYLDGNVFDDPDYPLRFNRTDQYQVIPGIMVALQYMHPGDTAVAVIPSHLAFGEKGSKDGRVPPYEPVLYGLKLLTAAETGNLTSGSGDE